MVQTWLFGSVWQKTTKKSIRIAGPGSRQASTGNSIFGLVMPMSRDVFARKDWGYLGDDLLK